MNTARLSNLNLIAVICLWLALSAGTVAASETNSPAAAATSSTNENAISSDTLRIYLQLQEQIREAQLAMERTRAEAERAALKNGELLADRLSDIERSVAAQQDAMKNTGNFMLTVMAIFGGTGFLGIVLTAYFQWRAVNRLTEFSARPANHDLMPALAALGNGENHLMNSGLIGQSNATMVGALERLEKRLRELEQSVRPSLNEQAVEKNGVHEEPEPAPIKVLSTPSAAAAPSVAASTAPAALESSTEVKLLLDQGQSLLNQDKAQEAIAHFDEALHLEPHNTDALVKKGTALEKIRRLAEAIECYDRAIALDGSMTIAYLYKGGLFNRMERFSEAVECYEQALRTQEKRDV